MQTINIHAGAVGTGKTKNYIKPQVEAALADKYSLVLHVVVSIKAQEEARKDFPNAKIINCEDEKITSALQEIYSSITDVTRTNRHVIITHAAFQRLTYVESLHQWKLFVDEAMMPYRTIKYSNSIESKATIRTEADEPMDWTNLFSFDTELQHGYIQLKSNIDRHDSIAKSSTDLMKLSDPNWKIQVSKEDIQSFLTTDRKSIEFLQVFDSAVMKAFEEVHVVGADVNNLLFGKWLENEGFDLQIHTPFTKRSGTKINLYTTNVKNSKTLQAANANYLLDFRKSFEAAIGDLQTLRLANVSNKMTLDEKYTRLKHNMHSQNAYRHSHRSVLFESALNPSTRFKNWLTNLHGISTQTIDDTLTVDVAYQLLGRTPYRNDDNKAVIEMGVPCAKTAARLLEKYLTVEDVQVVEFKASQKRKTTQHSDEFLAKQPAKTAAERKRDERARKKAEAETALIADVFEGAFTPVEPVIEDVEEPVIIQVEIIEEKPLTTPEEDNTIALTGLARLKHRKMLMEAEGYEFNITKQTETGE